MRHVTEILKFASKHPVECIDITECVRSVVAASGIRDGLVTIFTQHTTTAIKINERCDRLQDDMVETLSRLVPGEAYRHDTSTVDGRPNARGHLMSLLMNASETVPIASGELGLGGWQSIFLFEFDGPRPERTIIVKVLGE